MPSDLAIALAHLSAKQKRYQALWDYYEGRQPLVYSTERLREVFNDIEARFSANWCAVVVDSVLDRLELETPQVPDDQALSDTLSELWLSSGMEEQADDVHEDLLVTGEAFIIAWPDGEGGALQAVHNPAIMCHAEYWRDNPLKLRFVAKWWVGEDGHSYVVLYYADRIERYRSRQKPEPTSLPDERGFEPDNEPVENPYGVLCAFHLRSSRRRPISQLALAVEPQDAINKLLADMMVAAEFGAFKQRWIITQGKIGDLKNAPNELWVLPAGTEGDQHTAVGEFSPTDLGNYLQAIDRLAMTIGIITRTPKHYFWGQSGQPPSGEALIALEAPLNRKAGRLINRMLPVWRDLCRFLLHAGAGVDVEPSAISVPYAPVETIQPRTRAEIRTLSVQAGIPLETALRDEGWTEDELGQMAKDKEAERQRNMAYAELALARAEQQMQNGEEA